MILDEWKLVLGRRCPNCNGTGIVSVHNPFPMGAGVTEGPCPFCKGLSVVTRLATKKETLELLMMIPDLVQEAFELPSLQPCTSRDRCNGFGDNPHNNDCCNY